MSVMEKYGSKVNFDVIWKSFRCLRTKLSQFFMDTVKTKDLKLYDKIITLNQDDGYLMSKTKTCSTHEKNIRTFKDDISTTTFLDSLSARSYEYSTNYCLSDNSSSCSKDSQTGDRLKLRISYSPSSRSRERNRRDYKEDMIEKMRDDKRKAMDMKRSASRRGGSRGGGRGGPRGGSRGMRGGSRGGRGGSRGMRGGSRGMRGAGRGGSRGGRHMITKDRPSFRSRGSSRGIASRHSNMDVKRTMDDRRDFRRKLDDRKRSRERSSRRDSFRDFDKREDRHR